MYLELSDSLDEIIMYGINPLIEFLYTFQDDHLDIDNPDSQETVLWYEIMGKALKIREVARRVNKTSKTKAKPPEKNEPGDGVTPYIKIASHTTKN